MKLSKAQQAVMDHAKSNIDFARNNTYYTWIRKHFYTREVTDEEIQEMIERNKKAFGYEYEAKRFEEERNGITLAQCKGTVQFACFH